jgi:hypothetical protein
MFRPNVLRRIKSKRLAGRGGLDSNPLHAFNPRKLFILRSDKTDKTGTSAEVIYPADTRTAEVCRAEVYHAAH